MRLSFFFTVLFVSLFLAPLVSFAANKQVGLDAFLADDYVTALNELEPIASQGDVQSQFIVGILRQKEGAHAESFKWLLMAAKQGHAEAAALVASHYQEGVAVAKNIELAFKWYKLAADKGYKLAQHQLGYFYQNGLGVKSDDEESFRWFLLAANQGYALAQFAVGSRYFIGKGVKADTQAAKEWIEKSAKQGYAKAQSLLGKMYKDGTGTIQDYISAREWLGLAAEQGDANAQIILATMHMTGKGGLVDFTAAYELSKRAAEAAVARGSALQGLMFANGWGVPKNLKYAHMWQNIARSQGNEKSDAIIEELEKKLTPTEVSVAQSLARDCIAKNLKNCVGDDTVGVLKKNDDAQSQAASGADELRFNQALKAYKRDDFRTALPEFLALSENGHAKSMFWLGLAHEKGLGVPQNFEMAFTLYGMAAKRDLSSAQFKLGEAYRTASGTDRDINLAIKYFLLAGENGTPSGYFKLGEIYTEGTQVPKDVSRGVSYFKLGAETGSKPAQFKLAKLHSEGNGVIKSSIYAYVWANIAASEGWKLAVDLRDSFAKKLTKAELLEAQNRTQDCLANAFKNCSPMSAVIAKASPPNTAKVNPDPSRKLDGERQYFKSQHEWQVKKVGNNSVHAWVYGELTEGDKLEVRFLKDGCFTGNIVTGVFTASRKQNLSEFKDQPIEVQFMNKKVDATVLFTIPFIGGHRSTIDLGWMAIEGLLNVLARENPITIKYLDSDNIKISDYFDVTENHWSGNGVETALKKASKMCAELSSVQMDHKEVGVSENDGVSEANQVEYSPPKNLYPKVLTVEQSIKRVKNLDVSEDQKLTSYQYVLARCASVALKMSAIEEGPNKSYSAIEAFKGKSATYWSALAKEAVMTASALAGEGNTSDFLEWNIKTSQIFSTIYARASEIEAADFANSLVSRDALTCSNLIKLSS